MSKIYSYTPNYPVLNEIPENSKRILDIGCGNGGIINFLPDSVKVDGVTFSSAEFRACQQKLNKVYYHNLEQGLPDEIEAGYDVIIASHLLEHIAYPEKLLNDIHKRMRENTIFIVALPNIMHYKYRFQLLFGKFEYSETGVMDYTHLRWYTFDSAFKLLKKYNFKVIKFYADGKPPLYRITRLLPDKAQNTIKSFLFFLSKGFFGMQMIFILKK